MQELKRLSSRPEVDFTVSFRRNPDAKKNRTALESKAPTGHRAPERSNAGVDDYALGQRLRQTATTSRTGATLDSPAAMRTPERRQHLFYDFAFALQIFAMLELWLSLRLPSAASMASKLPW